MPASHKPNPNREIIALRRVKAIELRVEGRKSVREIATELKCSPTTVWNDLSAIVAQETEGVADLVKVHREVEVQRLDAWTAMAVNSLHSARNVDETAKMLNTLATLSARRAKLLGLDAPIKQEIDATIGTAAQTAASARAMMQSMFATSQDLGLDPAPDDEPN